jgi:hypothetical protein
MKKFIAPEVRVVRYDSSILCASATIGVGDDIPEGSDIEFDAPRRRSIFQDDAAETKTSGRLQ